ncbi:MAG: Holliday junction branch migration protein RuvA [Bacteroidota bacterium]
MISHIKGKISEKTPAFVVIDCNGVGYGVQISLHTYEQISALTEVKLLTHLSIKEDAHTLYGFADDEEKQLFLQLISVNGVGTNTARMILSSLKPAEIRHAIGTGNWTLLKSIKGIGPKTAQRLVVDLQDKVKMINLNQPQNTAQGVTNSIVVEALGALVSLGFTKADAEKVLVKVRQTNPDFSVEQLIKQALKQL